MKKLLILLALLFFCASAEAAITLNLLPTKEQRAYVTKVGYTLLNANRIPHKITFSTKISNDPSAHIRYKDNEVVVTTSLLESVAKEDELAAILAHEISRGVDYRKGILKGYFSSLSVALAPRKYEYKADKRAVDYMVKAGYNPVASIVALNLIVPQTRYEWCKAHPLTSRRMAIIYEYIYTKYPQYLVNNEYKDNLVYQNFLLTSRENRTKLEQKIKNNSNKKVKYQ